MIGIDTNVLVRFLVRDDEAQFAKASSVIRRESAAGRGVLVSLMVVLELEWVLRSRYGFLKPAMVDILSGLLDSADVRIEDEPSVEEALYVWKDGVSDFSDCLIGSHNRRLGCDATFTFDLAARKLPGFIAT